MIAWKALLDGLTVEAHLILKPNLRQTVCHLYYCSAWIHRCECKKVSPSPAQPPSSCKPLWETGNYKCNQFWNSDCGWVKWQVSLSLPLSPTAISITHIGPGPDWGCVHEVYHDASLSAHFSKGNLQILTVPLFMWLHGLRLDDNMDNDSVSLEFSNEDFDMEEIIRNVCSSNQDLLLTGKVWVILHAAVPLCWY